MHKNLYLNIDDDISRVIKKIQHETASDLTLVVPKGAFLFANPAGVLNLERTAKISKKKLSIVTSDQKIQSIAHVHGFELRGLETLKKTGSSMDVVRHAKTVKKSLQEKSKPTRIIRELPPLETIDDHIDLEQMPIYQNRSAFLETPVDLGFDANAEDNQELPITPVEPFVPIEEENIPYVAPIPFQKPEIIAENDTVSGSKGFVGKFIKIALVIGIIIALLLVFVILPEADITVYAHIQPVIRDYQISVDAAQGTPDVTTLTIPGKIINEDITVTKAYSATGQTNVGIKAQGTVEIYNFSKQTYKLDAATTTLVVGSKIYHFQNDITGIKPTKYLPNSQDVDPNSLIAPIAIIADQGGEDYDLPGGTQLAINNAILGSQPQILYAKNTDPITGGFTRLQNTISATDQMKAKTDLTNQILGAAQTKLNDLNAVLLSTGSTVTNQIVTFDQPIGTATNQFNGTVTAHVSGLTFESTQLKTLIEQRVSVTLDVNKYLVTDQEENITDDYKNVSIAQGTGLLTVHFQGIMAAKVDSSGIASEINGKNAFDIKELLLSDPNIDGVDITFKPFWVKSVPRFSGKVYVTVQINPKDLDGSTN